MKTAYTNATSNDKMVYYRVDGEQRERVVKSKDSIKVHPNVKFHLVKSVTIGE